MINFPHDSWRKSSRSTEATACVEVATARGLIGVRDSKNPNGPVMVVAQAEWTNFLTVLFGCSLKA
jgi:hypothetical protein